MGTTKTILVVDDETTIREVVRRYLERDGYTVYEAADSHAAFDAIEQHKFDLIVLDLMLPGMNGLSIMRHIHERSDIPIIMLTARGETVDRIIGLDMGADDYVAKPFSPQELISRVRAVLRRSSDSAPEHQPPITIAHLHLDLVSRSITIRDHPVILTVREFDLLWHLARHPGQVFTREQLLDRVWGYDYYGDPSTVTVHIRRLREKIEDDPSNPHFILTVWGIGYQFRKDTL